jgi:methylenetetrahydrofolate dehydrogenase (NADP+)/methenyltetrahydrofolate cyclohydrolase
MAMTATLMDGKAVSQQVLEGTAQRVQRIVQQTGVQPCLATILVGGDPASATYVKMKQRRCQSVGMRSIAVELPESTTTQQLIDKIQELGRDASVHGILLQHPVPHHIDERAAFEAIPAAKDVDGVTIKSFGTIAFDLPLGVGGAGYGCCTPAGIMTLLKAYKVDLSGKHAVVIGRSAILGKPMAMMLLSAHATVTICHSRTRDLPGLVQQGDIVVAAVGKARFVQGSWIKPGAVVIDAGYTAGNIGDVDFDSAAARASLITPVPGGVGPMTIATLIDQSATAAARQLNLSLD